MKRLLLTICAVLTLSAAPALAQTTTQCGPGVFYYGAVPTTSQWLACFTSLQPNLTQAPTQPNQFLAGPTTGGAAAPTFRNFALADIPPQSDGTVIANISGSSGTPTASTLSSVMDHVFSPTQGTIAYRGSSGWTSLPPSASNGQTICIASNTPYWCSNRQAMLAGNSTAQSSNTTEYYSCVGSLMGATESPIQQLLPFGGTFRNLYARASQAPGTGQTFTITLRLGGAGSTLTCTISGAAATCQDTTDAPTALATSQCSLQVVSSSTAAPASLSISTEYDNP